MMHNSVSVVAYSNLGLMPKQIIEAKGNVIFILVFPLKNTSDDPKHKRLLKQLVAVKRNLGQSSAHDALGKYKSDIIVKIF